MGGDSVYESHLRDPSPTFSWSRLALSMELGPPSPERQQQQQVVWDCDRGLLRGLGNNNM